MACDQNASVKVSADVSPELKPVPKTKEEMWEEAFKLGVFRPKRGQKLTGRHRLLDSMVKSERVGRSPFCVTW